MNENYCYLNGKTLPISEAKVGVEDIGLLRGYGIYEGLAAINGKPFRFADHWNRFLSGAHTLNLNVPITEDKAGKVIEELVSKSDIKNRAAVKMILTGGQTISGIEYDFNNPTFYIIAREHEPHPEICYREGVKVTTYRHLRMMPEIKTINYIRAVSLQDFKKQEGAKEILYVYDGDLLEGASSNVFIVKNGVVITPAEDTLEGITKKVVLELCDGKYKVEERIVREEELKIADEVFITSTFRDIMPVVKVDDFIVADGKVGPVTGDLMKRFADLINM